MDPSKKIVKGKNGVDLYVGLRVKVGDPLEDEIHTHEFDGTIDDFRNGNVTVEDMDGNFFEVSPENVSERDED